MKRGLGSAFGVVLCTLAACAGTRCDMAKGGPSHGAASEVQAPRPDARLLIVTDARGYLEPCGCQQRPLGGVDKLATIVAEARRDQVPTVLLAAGDFAVGTELRPEDVQQAQTQELWRAETFVSAWKEIGVAAVAPGPLDLAQAPPGSQTCARAAHLGSPITRRRRASPRRSSRRSSSTCRASSSACSA